ILDTGLALQMRESADLIQDKLEKLQRVVAEKAIRYKYSLNIGRTHGVH
ncbi:MAG TPA: adenylosuccinate lyase, partial [Syntrophomonas wolfei]|nr:adenylosuccinate lyase [Syntrophomonas wolfei]